MNWLMSSQDPKQISNTVKGVVMMGSALVLVILRMLDIPFTEKEYITLATEIGAGFGAIWTVWGLLMKVVVKFGK